MDPQYIDISSDIKHNIPAWSEELVSTYYYDSALTDLMDGEKKEMKEKSIRDIGYHLSYLAESIANNDKNIFGEYIVYTSNLFRNLNFNSDVLQDSLIKLRTFLQSKFGDEQTRILGDHINEAIERLESGVTEFPSYIDPEQPYADLAHEYLESLLNQDRKKAYHLIIDAIKDGTTIENIYMQVFQTVQHEIGRLWQYNKISVAQEHYCTAATQLIMSQLYPYIFKTRKNGLKLIASSVGDELHEIGIRMVADLFELAGWESYYFGANTPQESILRSVVEIKPDLIAISCTLTPHLQNVREIISEIRTQSEISHIPILVGGYPFVKFPDLWKSVGADGSAPNASAAVELGKRLVADTRNSDA